MVLCVVPTKAHVFTHFFNKKEKVNAFIYCKVLQKKIIPWMKKYKASGNQLVFQQDSAPPHIAKKTTNLLKWSNMKFWNKEWLPSSSPEINPLDYYFWGANWDTCDKPHRSITTLKTDIKKAMSSLSKSTFVKFHKRVESVITAEGSYIVLISITKCAENFITLFLL